MARITQSLPPSDAVGLGRINRRRLDVAFDRIGHLGKPAFRARLGTSTWDIGLVQGVGLGSRLGRAGFTTLADLRGVSDEELLAIDGIGPKSLEVIRAALVGLDRLDQEGGE